MANALYTFGKENLLGGDIDYDANNIKFVCMDHADDTPVLATDDALNDLAAAGRVATSGNLASKTKTGGVADAADVTLSAVSGDQFESLNGYKDTGVESTSLLIWYQDTGTGLPFTPSGGDISVVWNASGIFAL